MERREGIGPSMIQQALKSLRVATAAGLRAAVFVVAAGIVVTLIVALNLGSDSKT